MTTLSRDLSEINNLVKENKKIVNEATKEAKLFDKALKVDPHDYDVANEKVQSLKNGLTIANESLKKLQATQKKYVDSGGDVGAAEYKKLQKEIINTTTATKQMNGELTNLNKQFANGNFDKLSQQLKSVNDGLTNAQNKLKPISKYATIILGSITALSAIYIRQGDVLDKLSQKYQINVESLQQQQFFYDRASGSSDNYSAVLDKLNKSMASARKGSTQTLELFKKLGISQKELETSNLQEVYEKVFSSLNKITDETSRYNLANELLGNQGIYLAQVTSLTTEELKLLNEEFQKNGIISSEEAASAAQVADAFDNLQMTIKKLGLQFVVGLLPVIEDVFNLLNIYILPVVSGIVNAFSNLNDNVKGFMLISLVVLAILPKVFGLFKIGVTYVNLIRNAFMLFNIALSPVQLSIIAIVSGIMLIIAAWSAVRKLFGKSEIKVETPKIDVDDLKSTMSNVELPEMSSNVNQKQDYNLNIKINSTGDTQISKQNADLIAEALAPKVNVILGGNL